MMSSLREIIQNNISIVEKEFQKLARINDPSGIIRWGSWANQRIIATYISYFPKGDLTRESVDFMIQLTLLDNSIKFRADILRSNGELIIEVIDRELERKDDISSEVSQLSEKSSESFITKLREREFWMDYMLE